MVQGRAGVGKTWMIDRAVRLELAERPDVLVLRAGGHSAETGLPYAALHQLLLEVADDVARLPEPQRASIDQALASTPLDPHARFSTAVGVYGLLVELSARRPVVVIVDDAHWVDSSTLTCLSFAGRRLEHDPVTLILATRSGAPLGMPGEVVELRLLDAQQSRRLLQHEHPDLAPAVRDEILRSSGGLPVALCEGPADLSAAQRAGLMPLPPAMPIGPSLSRLYEQRISQLSQRERLALLAATLQPLERARLLSALSAAGVAADALDASIAAGLLDESGAAVHSTVRSAIRRRCTLAEYEHVARAVAGSLDGEPQRQVWLLDSLGETAAVTGIDLARMWAAAADDAERRGAWAEAASAHEHRARCTEGASRSASLRAAAASAARAGRPDWALAHLDELVRDPIDPDDRLLLEAQRLMLRSWWQPQPADEAGVQQLIADNPAAGRRARGHLHSILAMTALLWGEHATALRATDAAQAMRDANQATVIDLLRDDLAGVVGGRPGAGAVLRRDWIDELTDAQLLDPTLPVYLAAFVLALTDLPRQALTVATRLGAVARSVGDLGHLALATALLAVIAERDGDTYAARAHYTSAIGLCLDTDFLGPVVHVQLRYAYLLAAIGDERGCRDALLAASGHGMASPVTEHLAIAAEGRLALSTGRCEQAVPLLLDAEARQHAMQLAEPSYVASTGDLVEALWRLRRAPEARAALAAFAVRATAAERHSALAIVSRCRGVLDGPGAIDGHFAEAHRHHALAPDGYQVARTELCWGMRLRRAGRRRDARAPLRRALDAFEAMGAVPWAAYAAAELTACGERRRTAWAAVDELTPRELEVAVAVAAGASNPAAAAALCVSVRTVEDHLTRVYRKLRISGRDGLAAALRRPDQSAAARI